MISDFFLQAFVQLIGFIASPLLFFNDVVADPALGAALGGYLADIKALAATLPLTVYGLLGAFAALLFTEFALFTYKVIMWGIRKIPGIG